LTPVLREPGEELRSQLDLPTPPPDHVVYSDWWRSADERRRRVAVGTRRYSLVRDLLGAEPEWEHFVDPETGQLLGHAELRGEEPKDRHARVNRVRHVLALLRAGLVATGATGWLRDLLGA
jgi:hypothetical protein